MPGNETDRRDSNNSEKAAHPSGNGTKSLGGVLGGDKSLQRRRIRGILCHYESHETVSQKDVVFEQWKVTDTFGHGGNSLTQLPA